MNARLMESKKKSGHMPPMLNFYSEQIDSSTELPGEPSKTEQPVLYIYLIMLTIAEQSFREAATMHVH
jgi:hypothetical protein